MSTGFKNFFIESSTQLSIKIVVEMEFAAWAEKKPYFPHLISISLNKVCKSSNLHGLSLWVRSLTILVN